MFFHQQKCLEALFLKWFKIASLGDLYEELLNLNINVENRIENSNMRVNSIPIIQFVQHIIPPALNLYFFSFSIMKNLNQYIVFFMRCESVEWSSRLDVRYLEKWFWYCH